MSFESDLSQLSAKIEANKGIIRSEEHTKMAFIVPFIGLLGYNVSDPNEVIPEYTCDFGTKKGEKVDYCIMNNKSPYILIECKDCRNTLTSENISQLYRYYSVSSAKLAILTNGIDYMLFTDSVEKNKMDSEPFHKFNLLSLSSEDINIIKMLLKDNLNVQSIYSYSKVALLKSEVEKWLDEERGSLSKNFIGFIKKTINTYDLPNDIIESTVRECLFGIKPTKQKSVEPKKQEKIKVEEKPSENKDEKTKVIKKDAKGQTGIFSLNDESLLDIIAGSTLVFVEINNIVYDYTIAYQVLHAIIDYCMDVLHYDVDFICNCDKSLATEIFYKDKKDKYREYHGIYFYSALSFDKIIKDSRQLCDFLNIDKSTFKLGLISKDDKSRLADLNFDKNFYKQYLLQLKNDEN
jgi:hypothetical protein